jgi:hypothetical protein
MQATFEASKEALAKTTLLSHPLPQAKLSLVVDSSATHVGVALQQQRPGSTDWEPLGFFSRKLEPAQVKYSAFDRELLAYFLAWYPAIQIHGGGEKINHLHRSQTPHLCFEEDDRSINFKTV